MFHFVVIVFMKNKHFQEKEREMSNVVFTEKRLKERGLSDILNDYCYIFVAERFKSRNQKSMFCVKDVFLV